MAEQKQERQELLEIYKLHAELADHMSQRREGANRLYVSLLVGLLLFAGTVQRFGTSGSVDGISADTVLIWTGILGVGLSVSWHFVLRSYRKINACKFIVLQDLERYLAYAFFTKEDLQLKKDPQSEVDSQSKDMKHNPYWKRSVWANTLPLFSSALFIIVFLFGVCR